MKFYRNKWYVKNQTKISVRLKSSVWRYLYFSVWVVFNHNHIFSFEQAHIFCVQNSFRRSNSVILELRFLNVSLGVQTKSGGVHQKIYNWISICTINFSNLDFLKSFVFFFKKMNVPKFSKKWAKMNENSDQNVK